jgi:hypothetical protein
VSSAAWQLEVRCTGPIVFMNSGDMRDRGLDEFDLVDITSFSRDATTRAVYGYRAVRYDIPRGCAAGCG